MATYTPKAAPGIDPACCASRQRTNFCQQFFLLIRVRFAALLLITLSLSGIAFSETTPSQSNTFSKENLFPKTAQLSPGKTALEPRLSNEADASNQKLIIASAANFKHTLDAIVERYQELTGKQTDIQVVSGSSGKLSTQILNGAPFDIFFSADKQNPDRLVNAGKALEDSRKTYAIGRLVLATRNPAIEKPLIELLSGSFRHLAIANPKLAPYGRAAADTLNALGVNKKSQGKLVQGENIAQTFQFIATGNAELGLVALSQLQQLDQTSGHRYRHWLVPESLHQPIEQDVVIVNRANDPDNENKIQRAQHFLQFVASQHGAKIISANGYTSSLSSASTAANSEQLITQNRY